ncbi:hypothetical protein J2X36_005359 [Methylobacterium sp. BE186]|uniref:hypothetical protein n=1 Tax=Methylobacterium sp. BE186 TaxID=2817715 RepID=UPI00285FDD68|nr:hypothetical protein [Methylobacterium sp. BE186]MDR7040576.1 hypothetical protein [Methylobacterium sp. BE186]
MIEPDQTAHIVKVSWQDEGTTAGRQTMFYAALTESPEEAVELVRQAVKADAEVELTEARLSQDTAQAIDLLPGFARAL